MPKGQYDRQSKAEVEAAVPTKPALPEDAQPIETAPRTGETVWLYNEVVTHGIRGFWRKSRHFKHQRWVVNNCWADPMTRKPLSANWTHWRPL